MKIVKNCCEMQRMADEFRRKNLIIGLVPTMGYFHEGHLSLMRESIKKCNMTVVSLFVNPTQFAPSEDLAKYSRDFDGDRKVAEDVGVDILFCPEVEDIYSKDHDTFVEVKGLSQILCGVSRPTHFRGVTTIVAKLFNIVKPHRTYFGQKDSQQAIIIKKMIRELNFDVEMYILPIIREEEGLAMSSRNKYLSHEERKRALALSAALDEIKRSHDKGIREANELRNIGLKKLDEMIDKKHDRADYLEIRDAEDLLKVSSINNPALVALAVHIGKTRLIDNMILKNES
ncbi:pantoate--beta-alanine ligase [bacterium]|nr:pantoate--beta-alanine ligase [bacterium]